MDQSNHLKLQYIAMVAALIALITGLYNGLNLLAGLSVILILISARRIRSIKRADKKE